MMDGKVEGQKVEADAEGLPHAPRHGAKQYRAGKVWPTNESPNQSPPQNFDIAKSRPIFRIKLGIRINSQRIVPRLPPAGYKEQGIRTKCQAQHKNLPKFQS